MSTNDPVSHDRYGVPVYSVNPSLGEVKLKTKAKRHELAQGKTRAVLYDEETNAAIPGQVSVLTREYVDTEKFIKIYAAAMPVLEELKTAGFKVFGGIWHQILGTPGIDRVELTKTWFDINMPETISKSVLTRGMAELLEKEIVYKSTVRGMYYYNVSYFYNGCRIPALNVYHQYVNADLEGSADLDPETPAGALELDNESGVL